MSNLTNPEYLTTEEIKKQIDCLGIYESNTRSFERGYFQGQAHLLEAIKEDIRNNPQILDSKELFEAYFYPIVECVCAKEDYVDGLCRYLKEKPVSECTDRLTERDWKNKCAGYLWSVHPVKDINDLPYYKRLAEYEDAEEQGLLIRVHP